ncbi:NAD-dependent epimerase/dehydratase family protein [Actinoplanes sp. CA-131856]
MKVLLIGGTGYIGRAVARELSAAGHTAVVLARSEASKAKLAGVEVEFVDGSVEDLDVVVRASQEADATVYLAIGGPQGGTPADRAAIEAILAAYADTGKAFVLTSGLSVFIGSDVAVVTDETPYTTNPALAWRVAIEKDVLASKDHGVRPLIVRPPLVYGEGSASVFITALGRYVRSGAPAFYIGDGANRIVTIHVNDLARLYVSALETAPAGTGVNAVGGTVLGYDLAHAMSIAAGSDQDPVSLTIPEAVDAVGPAAPTLALDLRSSELDLAALLRWTPREPSLLSELVEKRISLD